MDFFLLHADAFKQERLALHAHRKLGEFPVSRSYLRPLYAEFAAFVQMSEKAPRKLHLIHELPIDADEALLLRVNPDLPLKFLQYLSFTRRGRKLRIRFEHNSY